MGDETVHRGGDHAAAPSFVDERGAAAAGQKNGRAPRPRACPPIPGPRQSRRLPVRAGEDEDKGRVTVVFGGAKGYRTSGGPVYGQNTRGVPGKAEKNDGFGVSVALLDHDVDGRLDLTVGARGENSGDGAIPLLRGAGTSFATKDARTVTLEDLGSSDAENAGFGATLGH